MTYSENNNVDVSCYDKYKIKYERKKVLMGLIQWDVIIDFKKISRELRITIPPEYLSTEEEKIEIYLNGKKLNNL